MQFTYKVVAFDWLISKRLVRTKVEVVWLHIHIQQDASGLIVLFNTNH